MMDEFTETTDAHIQTTFAITHGIVHRVMLRQRFGNGKKSRWRMKKVKTRG